LDFAQLHTQLQTHKHLTLQLLWEEYRETQPDGYGYSRFCELYRAWDSSGSRSVIPIDPDQTGVSAPLDAFADLRVCGSGQA